MSDIAGKRGFIDETDNFYACGETVTVTTGDVFRPLTDSSGIFEVYHKNDGSSSASRVYFYIASPASLELYGIGQVFDNLPAGKSFVAWNANSGGNGQSYTAGSSVRNSVQLFAQWKNSGGSSGNPGGGGYISSAPSTTTPSVTTTGQNSSTETTTTTAVPIASTQGGTVSTTVSTTMGNEIVKQAVANKSEDVVIAPKVTGNVTKTEISIPASTMAQIGSQTNASLTIATPVANVTIPNGGLSGLFSISGTVTVTAEKTGNTMELSVTMGGKTVDYVPGGVALTVPVSYTTPGTVAVLVNADGTREVVRKSVADKGNVRIPLDGSTKLEIVDNSKYFADVPSTSWAADAVAFASSHELFTAPARISSRPTFL